MRKAFRLMALSVVGLLVLSLGLVANPATTQASTFSNWPVVQQGSTGENVWTIQYMLVYRGYSLTPDGQFGPATASAVQSFQSARGLTADGVVGNNTWEALIAPSNVGSNGAHVKALQRQLNVRGYGLTVDGAYGSGTDSAVRDYKTKNFLSADGGAGLTTWNKLVTGAGDGGSRAQIAQALINSGRVSFWTYHDSGVVDNANASAEINQTAQGLPAQRSSYGTAPGGSVYLSVNMLSAMQNISQSYSLSISEMAGGSHSANSYHYLGTAMDIASIGGSGVSYSNPYYQTVMQMCRNLGAIEVLGPGDPDHDTHVHCAWSN